MDGVEESADDVRSEHSSSRLVSDANEFLLWFFVPDL